jgi:hypothetical protein
VETSSSTNMENYIPSPSTLTVRFPVELIADFSERVMKVIPNMDEFAITSFPTEPYTGFDADGRMLNQSTIEGIQRAIHKHKLKMAGQARIACNPPAQEAQ